MTSAVRTDGHISGNPGIRALDASSSLAGNAQVHPDGSVQAPWVAAFLSDERQ